LTNEQQAAGVKTIGFNSADLPSGIYFAKINSDFNSATVKLVVAK
jgi:hypothetical protein